MESVETVNLNLRHLRLESVASALNCGLEHVPYYPSGSVQKSGFLRKTQKVSALERGPALRIETQSEN